MSMARPGVLMGVVCGGLLGGLALASPWWVRDAEAMERYQAGIREVAESMPIDLGRWHGEPIDLPPSAQKLLRPNAMFSRSYRSTDTGEVVHFLFVHCGDARDLIGHYPPVCYPAHGWTQESASAVWSGEGEGRVGFQRYVFARGVESQISRMTVYHTMLSPRTGFEPSMERVEESAYRGHARRLGAAQVQFVFGGQPTERQLEIVGELLGHASPMVAATLKREVGP